MLAETSSMQTSRIAVKTLFTAPEKSSYHDNATWFGCSTKGIGVWLKPKERIIVLRVEEVVISKSDLDQTTTILRQASSELRTTHAFIAQRLWDEARRLTALKEGK